MKSKISFSRSSLALALLVALASCSSCSPVYVVRGAYEEAKILANRRPIAEVMAAADVSDELKSKLKVVQESRLFALQIGLNPKLSFTQYTQIDKDVLTWVVVGCRPDSFTVASWWYPFVGRMPYKGYFEKPDAEDEAKKLQSEGYETWVRGSEAFSTLGWFNDPVLTPTLKQPPARIANTVIHESVHGTVWISNNVAFNESMANFVGLEGAVQFFETQLQACSNEQCRITQSALRDAAQQARLNEFKIGRAVEGMYLQLKELYESTTTREEKLLQRERIFSEHVAPLRAEFPKMRILQQINNAEIVHLILYMTHLAAFEELYAETNRSWKEFFAVIKEIAEDVSRDPESDPFKLLDARLRHR